MDSCDCREQHGHCDTIALLHEERGGDAAPLLQKPVISKPPISQSKLGQIMASKSKSHRDNSDDDSADGHNGDSGSGGTYVKNGGLQQERVGVFRYFVTSIVVFASMLCSYATYTLYITSIEMVSSDVLDSGLTALRAKHLSNDPLALDKNAAAPGTCPTDGSSLAGAFTYPSGPFKTTADSSQKVLNASELSAHERIALQVDTMALYASVSKRVDSGQLVDWTISQRGYIFTAHNLGGILAAVPINRLGLKYGAKVMTFLCIAVSGVRMLLFPTVAGQAPFWVTFAFELVMGGFGGSVGILIYPIAAAWLLPHEANFLIAATQVFGLMSVAGTNFITTQMLAYNVAWRWCYYLPGGLLCLTSILWLIFGSDRPGTSRFISRDELEFVTSNSLANRTGAKPNENPAGGRDDEEGRNGAATNLGAHSGRHGRDVAASPQRQEYSSCFCSSQAQRDTCPANQFKRTPNWSIIFTCPTVWALIAVNFSYHWNSKVATLWPTFFANILHLDPSTIGIITGCKGVVALVFGLTFAYLTRKLSANRPFNISLTAYRRLNQVLSTLTLVLSVGLMVLLDCDFAANFVSVLLTPVVTGFNTISHEQMPFDLSSEDSGLLVSVIRFVAIGDLLALPASSAILTYAHDALSGDRLTWRLVWSFGLGLKILTCVFFVLVAKAEPKSYTRIERAGPCKSETAPR